MHDTQSSIRGVLGVGYSKFAPKATQLLLLLLVIGAGLAMVALRWTGEIPYGSDNDEYRLVARSLLAGAGPLSAGEGTKYPLGYPVLLAGIEALHLPLEWTALALNALLVFAIAALVALNAVKLNSSLACFAGAMLVVTSSELWNSVYSIMPDVLFVALVALMLSMLWMRRTMHRPVAVVGLTALTIGLMLVRSAGLIMVIPATAGLLTGSRSQKRWAWLPAAGGIACLILNTALVASLPPHTTGYARFFWSRDPFNASKGRITASELPGRFFSQMGSTLHDAAAAVGGEFTGSWLVAGALILAALAYWREERVITASMVIPQLCMLALWPYAAVRFALPLLCVGALGAAAVAAAIERASVKPWVATILVGGLLGLRLYHEGESAARTASSEKSYLSTVNQKSAEVVRWMQLHSATNEGVASFDYREWALRMKRPVVPLGYTSETGSLWAAIQSKRAQWFIASSKTFHKRKEYADRLLQSYPNGFSLAYSNSVFDVYRVALDQ